MKELSEWDICGQETMKVDSLSPLCEQNQFYLAPSTPPHDKREQLSGIRDIERKLNSI
jgi:hypothetical protein